MDSKQIRQTFIEFFEKKNHKFVKSSSVVPHDDPTLLFTNAGMNQFKPIFLNEKEVETSRAVNSQKCIRVSGKHNDLEEVGVDTYHHTFFEMLGNWSFGDYYKKEAIQWAWELLTEVWGLDKNRLWATVYKSDDEAFKLWTEVTDISPERVLKFGEKDNFWEMGETGPCGPCSEIHYYIGDSVDDQSADGVNRSDEYWELWNLVFIQYFRDQEGNLNDLPSKHVDTGAGLERIVAVLQGKKNNYETDLFTPIIHKLERITSLSVEDNPVPYRVIADHVRMLSVSIADGALPSNEGRGYVLRRILRRASRFGRLLGLNEPFLYQLIDSVVTIFGDIYPEIVDKSSHIKNVIKAEETSFNETLDRGLIHFERFVKKMKGDIIPGEEAFRLYDTYGFPLDLTQLIARERGFSVDEHGFAQEMSKQKERAKASGKFIREAKSYKWKIISKKSGSEFVGYEELESESTVLKYALDNGRVLVVLDKTPFYAESGGQIGDTGFITSDEIDLTVIDTLKNDEEFIHVCKGDFSPPKKDTQLLCRVNKSRRDLIRQNHTATHLLQAALQEVLGDHIHQAGSLVTEQYLRFDMTHYEKTTESELHQVESLVNNVIRENQLVNSSVQSFEDAKRSGAQALFGEKYGDEVRVINVGEFSNELCGGTHVNRTGDIGLFLITEESSLASGVRRIVAVTGQNAYKKVHEQTTILSELQKVLKVPPKEMTDRVTQILKQRKDLEKKLLQNKSGRVDIKQILQQGSAVGDPILVVQTIDVDSMNELKSIGDKLYDQLKNGIGVLGMRGEKKPAIVVVISQQLVESGLKAGEIAKTIGGFMNGGGGGKPHLATAGGKDNELLEGAMKKAKEYLTDLLKNR